VVLLSLLAACTAIRGNQQSVGPLPSDLIVTGQMEDLMQYYDSLRRQPPTELARVYDKVKQNFVQNKSDANRARLILLLILPNTPFRNMTSALSLLNEWPRNVEPVTGLQSFRNLLATLLVEQQRLSSSVDESALKLNESSLKLNELSIKLKEEQKRVETLQNQIEAIKSMEKNLILRGL
jgi:hypothetical protein